MALDKSPDKSLGKVVRRVLWLQVVFTLLFVLLVVLYQVVFLSADVTLLMRAVKASLFGSGLAIAGTILAGRSIGRVRCIDNDGEAGVSIAPVFIGLLNRLIVVGGGIGFALVVLRLAPAYLVLSFLVVQLAQICMAKKE